jgi:6-phosphogluconolactonase/glucosamine-6-phosphate isomerase/deaminase
VFLKEKNIYRISFTFLLINKAKQVLLLVNGEEKRSLLKKIASSRKSKNPLPVQLVKGDITWMTA